MMFGDVAQQLIKMMGHSGTVPGAINAEEIPAALEHLKHSLSLEKLPVAKLEDDAERSVSLAHRAFPLLNMLEEAIKHRSSVMWG